MDSQTIERKITFEKFCDSILNYSHDYVQDITAEKYFGFPIKPVLDAENRLLTKETNSIAYFSMEFGIAPSIYNTFSLSRQLDEKNYFFTHEVFSNYWLCDYLFKIQIDKMLDLPIYDSQCGAKMFRADAELENIISDKFKSKWIFDVELIARLIKYLQKTNKNSVHAIIYEIPLNTWVDVKGSKLKLRDFFGAIIDLFQIWKYMRNKSSF